ncbi:MAG TPA: amidohydrolase family protein, partial [Chloroflexota bacterium]|nr:amidohydrolase family protein [Chloroflexota bacterium]
MFSRQLPERIARTPFLDTHEHLLEEKTRLAGPGAHDLQPCDDFALLFRHYAIDDLIVAGMPPEAQSRFFSPAVEPAEKWRLVEPFYQRTLHTGYLQAVTLAIRTLFGEREWSAAAAERVSEAMRKHARPGLYRRMFDQAGVASCQVNSLETAFFCETQYPEYMQQDISLTVFTTGLKIPETSARSGITVNGLGDWHRVLDWAFARYGPRAVAVKSTAAYDRRLDYDDVPAVDAAPLFARRLAGELLVGADRKALEDHLMRECIRRAGAYSLPVKLHCGYYAGTGVLPLDRISNNAADLCPLLADFPNVRFVLMHMGYPYQEEFIALAKHYPNVWVDLCWAWILSPAACVRFVQEFLVSAPHHKLLTFGGDYAVIEPLIGHAAIARQGLGRALDGLVRDGWLSGDAAMDLVLPLMHDNAAALFRG